MALSRPRPRRRPPSPHRLAGAPRRVARAARRQRTCGVEVLTILQNTSLRSGSTVQTMRASAWASASRPRSPNFSAAHPEELVAEHRRLQILEAGHLNFLDCPPFVIECFSCGLTNHSLENRAVANLNPPDAR
jgi:hypothetical protein